MEKDTEKRKIIDLTGNREEKIAPKKPAQSGNPEGGHQKRPYGKKRHGGKKNGNGWNRAGKPDDQKDRRNSDISSGDPAGEAAVPEQAESAKTDPGFEQPAARDEQTVRENDGGNADEAASEVSPDAGEPEQTEEVVGIRFRGVGKTYYFSPNGIQFSEGEHAIVETVRGVEFGDVVMPNREVPSKDIVQPLKPVVRKADANDVMRFEINCRQEENAKPVFIEKCMKHKLEMQLVDVEYTFDGAKLTFYFTADGRVDFRELVKDLASVFHTRIDLRQIGPREEARLFGGLGLCGRPVCCKLFLSDCDQPSIKMAKDQGVSLAANKISGLCGERMCCLRFEQEVYEQESKRMPQPGTEIDTPKGRAEVLESSFISDKVKVRVLSDSSIRTFTTAELNGEEKTEKAARKPKAGTDGFLLRTSFDPEPGEEEEGGPSGNEQKKPKQSSQKPGRDKKNQANVRENKEEGGRTEEGAGKEQRQQPSGKSRHRYNRPNNIRKKGSGDGKKHE